MKPFASRHPSLRHHAHTLALALACASLLLGCGSNGDAVTESDPPPPPPTVIHGIVTDGPVRDATVQLYLRNAEGAFDGVALASAVSAADGSFRFEISDPLPQAATDILLSATGGSYCRGSDSATVDDKGQCSSGQATTLDIPLLGLAALAPGAETRVTITPVSSAAAEALAGTGNSAPTGSLSLDAFQARFAELSGGVPATATLEQLQPLLARINQMQRDGATTLAQVIDNIRSGVLKGAAATATHDTFDIVQTGPHQNLHGNPDDTLIPRYGVDPTRPLDNGMNGTSTFAAAQYPYFEERQGIDVAALVAIMEDDSVIQVAPHTTRSVTVGDDTYTGYQLADVVVRATKYRPRGDSLSSATNVYGPTSVIIGSGAEGRVAAYSFTELIQSPAGSGVIVAFEKNGAPLPAAEGAFAIVAPNDHDPWLRYVPRLKTLQVRNDYLRTTHTLNAGTPDYVRFSVSGQVQEEIAISAATPSTASSQGYYAVDMIGSKPISAFPTYYFQNVGPRQSNYWWGQGVRLTDVLDSAGLLYPGDKGACFVVVRSRNNFPALFSCGELYNSRNGIGDGLAGVENRSRSKGVLLVTDDFRQGTGIAGQACWGTINACNKLGDPADPAGYNVNMDSGTVANGGADMMNNQFIALITTEDILPFQAIKRWMPMHLDGTGTPQPDSNCPGNCIPWITAGSRYQQGITSMEVIYAGQGGNGNSTLMAPANP